MLYDPRLFPLIGVIFVAAIVLAAYGPIVTASLTDFVTAAYAAL
jgi:hypothetical protein